MICFDEVSFTYRVAGRDVPALTGVTLQVARGAVTAVLGSNGSGKSTLVKLANGIMLPESGRVAVDEIPTTDEARARDVRERVGIVFQNPDDQIVATTVEDDAAFGPENLGLPREEIRRRVDDALLAVGLSGLERREPHLLSGGQKQRLAIAGALAMRPAYLALDEPTSMLDSEGRAEVLRIIGALTRAGHGILHVTHDLADIAGADRAVVLKAGIVVFDGPPAELLDRPEDLAEWGLEIPGLAVLAGELRALGAPVPSGAVVADDLVAALWG